MASYTNQICQCYASKPQIKEKDQAIKQTYTVD